MVYSHAFANGHQVAGRQLQIGQQLGRLACGIGGAEFHDRNDLLAGCQGASVCCQNGLIGVRDGGCGVGVLELRYRDAVGNAAGNEFRVAQVLVQIVGDVQQLRKLR